MLAENWPWIVVIVAPMLLTWFGSWGKNKARW